MSRTTFTVAGETMTGLCLFVMDADGRIVSIEDWWPNPYEPPENRAHLVEREAPDG